MRKFVKDSRIARFATSALVRVRKDVLRKPSVALIALVSGVLASFLFTLPVAIVWAIFILFLVYGWDMRAPIAVGLLFCMLCIYFAIAGKGSSAEAAAVYAYFFLGTAGILWFVRYGYKRI